MKELKCKDCGGTIVFNEIASGSISKIPSESWCICVDRDTNKDKKINNVNYHNYATFIPDYLKDKPYINSKIY